MRVERDGDITWLRLDRPHRLNAVNPCLTEGLIEGFARAEAQGARVVILAGNGRAFCAGYDLRDFVPDATLDAARDRLQRLQDVTRATVAYPGPVIAAVQGYALGAGIEFALACDLVVASADAIFGFPEVAVGLSSTNGASALLPRLVGTMRAKELVMLGERFDAQRAADLGLVSRVVAEGEHESAAAEWARRLIEQPPEALRLAKRLIDSGVTSTLETALNVEVDTALSTLSTGEIATGLPESREGR